MDQSAQSTLYQPLSLPCGVVLKNRIIKSAMSDSLGDGRGDPTTAQNRLYERWAEGGLAVSIVGEVQGNPKFAEKPGNLVLRRDSDLTAFKALAQSGAQNGAQLWLQLGHAGAMSYPPTSTPKGPSALDLPGLTCEALSLEEVHALPAEFAETAVLSKELGFGGVQIHAAHGFLLSQFLSPLFNKREDSYGGSLTRRMRIIFEVVDAVRKAVGPSYPVAIKLNATDQLEGGFIEEEALDVVAALDATSIDLIDISGGTYFPGARSASDSSGGGPYFLEFAKRARAKTSKPLMVTGGFKKRSQAIDAIANGHADCVGLARSLALAPALPNKWLADDAKDPRFPTFINPPESGITAWYSMCLTKIGEDRETDDAADIEKAVQEYEFKDNSRTDLWNAKFNR